jgi:HK97 family phage major capsid protein
MDKIKSLQEQIGRNRKAMQDTYEKAEKDGREILNTDEQKSFDALAEESNGLEKKLQFLLDLEDNEATTASRIKNTAKEVEMSVDEYNEKYSKAFRNMVASGGILSDLEKEDRDLLRGKAEGLSPELRAQTTTTTGGGYLIPQGFQAEVDKQLAAYGGIRSISRILKTSSGANIEWPTTNDTGNTGRAEGVNDQVAITNIVYGQKQLDAYIYSSDQVLVPWALMEDSAFNMESHVGELLGERLARGTSALYVTGDGSGAPQGIAGAATEASGLPSGTAALTSDQIYDIKHSVDPAYRALGAHWLFNDTTLKSIKKLSVASGDDRPIWVPGLAFGEPSTIDGDPYAIDQNVAAPLVAGNKFIYYGNFKKFIIREVGSPRMVVMKERFADYLQTGMFMYIRHDSELLNSAAVVYGYDTGS